MLLDIIPAVFYFVIAVIGLKYIPFFRNIQGLTFRMLVIFFILKVVSGSALIHIYTYYYDIATADFYKYYSDGMVLHSALSRSPVDFLKMLTGISASAPHLEIYYENMVSWHRPWESPVFNDGRVIIRFNALVGIISFGSIHVHTVIINFLSLIGLVALYRVALKYTPQSRQSWLPWGIFCFPSLLFWGSGILTEGLLLMAFGLWLYQTDRILADRSLKVHRAIILMLALILLVKLKPYNLLLLIPCQIALYLSMGSKLPGRQLIYLTIMVFWVFIGTMAGYIFPQFDIISILANKQNSFVHFSLYVEAGSLVHTRLLKPELWDMILFFPQGLWHVLTRPHILEVHSLVILPAALENLMVLLLVFLIIVKSDPAGLKLPIVTFSVWFAVMLMGFVGVITPLHGAFVRYKILALPFLWIIFVNMVKLPDLKFWIKKFCRTND